MAFTSLEVRWFFRGELPVDDRVVEWFRSPGRVPKAEGPPELRWPETWREDIYLPVPGHEGVGIKVRGEEPSGPRASHPSPARLEFKGRTATVGEIDLGVGLAGPLERWAKWSCTARDLPAPLRDLVLARGPDDGIAVRKSRLLRTIRLSADGRHVEVRDPSRPIDRGLGFELTRVRVGREGTEVKAASWWTLAFEAYPSGVDPKREFAPVVQALMEGFPTDPRPGPSLAAGYPAWLLSVVAARS